MIGLGGLDPVFVNHQPWMADGNCVDLTPEEADRLFFPEPPNGYPTAARELCNACPVQKNCATFGERHEYGMFGGLTPKERSKR